MTLTAQQEAGIEKVKTWYENTADDFGLASVFRWFGYAGTGKTYTAAQIPELIGARRPVYGTFTGKAAHVLRNKIQAAGVNYPVTTIHSAIYFPTTSEEAKAKLQAARDRLADVEDTLGRAKDSATPEVTISELTTEAAHLQATIPELETEARRIGWEWNPEGEWSKADLIVLDEVSMVNAKLASDIEAYGVPILVLGDPAQLPPVEGGGFYTEATPDHLLTDIVRTALDNPITALATAIRQSQSAGLGLNGVDLEPASIRRAMAHDQVLVWSNKRRWAMISAMRRLMEFPADQVVPGDRIMCLTNNKDLAVFNGQQFEVLSAVPGALGPTLRVRSDVGVERTVPVLQDGFMGQDIQQQAKGSGAGMRGGRMLATYSQAITVHKAQGSEWARVYVVNETDRMMYMTKKHKGANEAIAQARQWLYTSVTRAQDAVTITAPRPN